MTVKRVASLPVPAVVGTAITGSPAASACTGTLKSRMCDPAPTALPCARMDIAFAVSMGDPPPKPIRQSYSPACSSAAPASITVSVGSGTVSLNTAHGKPGRLQRVQAAAHQAGADHVGIGDDQRARQAELGQHARHLLHAAAAHQHQPGRDDRGAHPATCWAARRSA